MTDFLTIAVSGSTGLVGSALVESLTTQGNRVRRLVRKRPVGDSQDIYWKPSESEIDDQRLEGVDAVVHLAGENIASGRWTAEKKHAIVESRVRGTRLLCEALAGLNQKPRVLISASAVGFYGDRGPHPVDEHSPPGAGFLAQTCVEWESQTRPAWEAGIRVVQTRTGMVLSKKGGALAKMLPLFRLGLGGRLGSGRQYMSWITLADLVRAIQFCVEAELVHGAVNTTAPEAVTNREFTDALGRAVGRPTVLPAPPFALRAAMGDMADEVLLASANVRPTRLLESGFEFHYPELDGALAHVLSGDGL